MFSLDVHIYIVRSRVVFVAQITAREIKSFVLLDLNSSYLTRVFNSISIAFVMIEYL
jgi:hypothetical protein